MLMNISVAATPYLAAPFISQDPGEIERAMGGKPIQLIGWRVPTQKRQANGSAFSERTSAIRPSDDDEILAASPLSCLLFRFVW